jgi:PmbA protein
MSELARIASDVVEKARARGADAAEVYVRRGSQAGIKVRNGDVEKLEEGNPSSIGIRLWIGDRVASTYTTDFADASIDRVIGDTLTLTKLTDPSPESALAEPERLVREVPALDVYDPATRELSPERKLEIVKATEAAALAHDERITRSAGASYGDLVMEHALANTHGFARGWRESYVSFSVQVVADDEDGKKRNGAWGTLARHVEDLDGPEEVGRIAGGKCVAQIGAGPVETRKLPVVFERHAGAALVGLLFSVLRGGAIERRASFLVDGLGKPFGSELLTLVDDPTLPRGPGSRPFDGEGLPGRRTEFFKEGTLESYALNCYYARKLGLEPTGHASRPASGRPGETSSNLFLAPGDRTPEEIVAEVESGFWCESMMGFGFNAATGDFSRGASGFLIENGKLGRPVSEVTISANFRDVFSRLDAVANDLVFDRSTVAPTFRIAEMTLAGK